MNGNDLWMFSDYKCIQTYSTCTINKIINNTTSIIYNNIYRSFLKLNLNYKKLKLKLLKSQCFFLLF